MEPSVITESMENKTILVTGSTGFLSKIFVEKVLRVQPNVKKLFLLIRAEDSKRAQQRLNDEVIGKDLFRVLKEKYGAEFNCFISNKVAPIAGDISCKDLGVKDLDLKEQLRSEIDFIDNIAGTTKFDERYDLALSINTLGAKHVMEFAKKCVKLQRLLHVSTAYVCGEGSRLVLEKPFKMGETLNGISGLDIEQELNLVKEKLGELHDRQATEKEETDFMKEFGLQRSKFYGWPNTYTFTKSMGEMLVGESRKEVPLCIIRPTIITSTYKEPFPGWIEGIRTIDSVIVGYGKGKITRFMSGEGLILDVIPGDMVVNAMIVAMVTHTNQQNEYIYQVGSSLTHPLKSSTLKDMMYCFFAKNPWIGRDGKPVTVKQITLFTTAASFERYMALRYQLPLKCLQMMNAICNGYFDPLYTKSSRNLNFVLRAAQLYKPYAFFKGIFDDSNFKNLRIGMPDKSGCDTYYFDPEILDWNEYFMTIHLPGIVRYLLEHPQQ